MTNPFYNVSGAPGAGTRGKSAPIRSEFTGIAAGFDLANTEILARATLAGATFTGPVKLPAVDLGEADTTKAATLAYVQAVLGAGGALVPPVAGQAGKFLWNDGSSYTWQFVIPEVKAANAWQVPRINAAGSAYAGRAFTGIGDGGIVSGAGVVTVTDAATVIDFSAAAYGALVTLPSATTLPPGFSFVATAAPAGANSAGVLDGTGELLLSPSTTDGSVLVLTSNATAAGTWKVLSEKLAVASISGLRYVLGPTTVTAAASTEAANKAMLKVATNQVLLATGDTTNDTVTLKWLEIIGLDVTVKATATVGGGGAGVVNHCTITAVGSSFLVTYLTGTNLKAVAVTLAGSSITAGSVQTVQAGVGDGVAASFENAEQVHVAANGSKVVWVCGLGASGNGLVIGGDVSGTTVTVGASVAFDTAGQGGRADVKALPTTADKFVVIAAPRSTNSFVHVITLTGTTPALGTAANFNTGTVVSCVSLHVISDTVGLVSFGDSANAVTRPLAINAALGTVAMGTSVTWGTSLLGAGTSTHDVFVFDNNTRALFVHKANGSTTISFRTATIDPATGIVTPTGSLTTINSTSPSYRSRVSKIPDKGIVVGVYNSTGLRYVDKLGAVSSVAIATGLHSSSLTAASGFWMIDAAVALDSTRVVVFNTDAATDVSVRAVKLGGL